MVYNVITVLILWHCHNTYKISILYGQHITRKVGTELPNSRICRRFTGNVGPEL